jgi:hypothetical protein
MSAHYEKMQATDLLGALKICLELRKDHFWSFRGQRKREFHVGLHGLPSSLELDDRLQHFRTRCMEFPPPHHIAEWDTWRWLFFAQHHRLTTRLLDWSKDPLVAIYFAVENILSNASDENDYGAIWALHVAPQHFIDSHKLIPPENVTELILVNPPPVTPRLSRQSGLFTYHPGDDCSALLDETPRRQGERLIKIKIVDTGGRNPTKHIRQQLGILNVHHGSLFPDPEGISQFINHEWPSIGYERYLNLLEHDDSED